MADFFSSNFSDEATWCPACGGVRTDIRDAGYGFDQRALMMLEAGNGGNPLDPRSEVAQSVTSVFCSVRENVAECVDSLDGLEALVADPCPTVRRAMSANPAFNATAMWKFVEDTDFDVRRAMWSRRDELGPELVGKMTEEFGHDPSIRTTS